MYVREVMYVYICICKYEWEGVLIKCLHVQGVT